MKKVKHLLNELMIFENELIKFCQIHQIDVIQKILKRRMNENVDDNELHREIFFQLQRLLKKINSYVAFLKTCENRFLKNFNFQTRVHLKQHDFNKQKKNIHNKSTFNEIVVIMILFDNMKDNDIIKRNILI